MERKARLEALPGWRWEPRETDWDEWHEALVEFARSHGHSRVPRGYVIGAMDLGRWVGKQRDAKGRGTISSDRAARLEALPGWTWEPLEEAWEEGFRLLVAFAEREGHTRVLVEHLEGDYRLGKWVHRQRHSFRKGKLTQAQISRLEAMPGWVWGTHDDAWEHGLAMLEVFASREGHASPPAATVVEGFRIGHWVTSQRMACKSGTLNPVRVPRLERVPGWTWDALAEAWDQAFALVQEFAAREGHARVPQNLTVDGFALGSWTTAQRARYRAGRLAPDRAARLEALPGWEWSPRTGPRIRKER